MIGEELIVELEFEDDSLKWRCGILGVGQKGLSELMSVIMMSLNGETFWVRGI